MQYHSLIELLKYIMSFKLVMQACRVYPQRTLLIHFSSLISQRSENKEDLILNFKINKKCQDRVVEVRNPSLYISRKQVINQVNRIVPSLSHSYRFNLLKNLQNPQLLVISIQILRTLKNALFRRTRRIRESSPFTMVQVKTEHKLNLKQTHKRSVMHG